MRTFAADTVVDVIVLHRPGEPPRDTVLQAIRHQRGVQTQLHLHVGTPAPGDSNRWVTIARARNQAKSRGLSPWVMFVDDDVQLDRDCVAKLLAELQQSPKAGAVAADYSEEFSSDRQAGHVTMGATLFRRDILQQLRFRSTDRLCECWCACLDIRHNGYDIQYSQTARARHLRVKPNPSAGGHDPVSSMAKTPEPLILAAFDRRDIDRFEHQFHKTLRAHGNMQRVLAVGYGLYPTERRRLESLPGVQLHWKSYNGQMVPVRRIADFAELLTQINPRTPVAYWDVADVIFQDSLDELWHIVQGNPSRLLAVIEPKGYPLNGVIPAWSLSIHDPHHRQRAFELLKTNPFLNSGFAAGTSEVMLKYFRSAVEMRHGPALSGTTDWGDQMCLNLYCHTDPSRWQAVDPRWNYCVHDRSRGEVQVTPRGQITSCAGSRISVAHGNARSLRQFSILHRD